MVSVKKEGLKNNSSQDRIWDKFKSYDKHMTWILYNDELSWFNSSTFF